MSPTAFAVVAILTVFLAVWMLMVIREPKRWRLWWLDFFGVLDVETTRKERREQEGHISLLAYTLCFLLIATAVSCSFWSFDLIRDYRRSKTPAERDLEFARNYVSSRMSH
ncbi:MAG: hypothetical protein JWO94_3919 [Verrucomicrobiaceae bacterium]|nr:hypothetical protein [Verrucomicrobiaceae bacterium]